MPIVLTEKYMKRAATIIRNGVKDPRRDTTSACPDSRALHSLDCASIHNIKTVETKPIPFWQTPTIERSKQQTILISIKNPPFTSSPGLHLPDRLYLAAFPAPKMWPASSLHQSLVLPQVATSLPHEQVLPKYLAVVHVCHTQIQPTSHMLRSSCLISAELVRTPR